MKIKIKYLPGATRLKKISKGDWVDLFAYKDYDLNVNTKYMINLGVAMELPEGYEALLAPRSSTFKTWGVLQTNSIGVIDNSFSGDNDIWHLPVYSVGINKIKKGDKICQFRIQKIQPEIEFEEVKTLNNESRGGFGSTGKR
jgi:dUTP pyrophosphatase